jgi:hypothetical protein
MFNPILAKKYDILVYKSGKNDFLGKVFSFFQFGRDATHVAIYIGEEREDDILNGSKTKYAKFESAADRKTGKAYLDEKDFDRIIVRRVKRFLNDNDIQRMDEWIDAHTGIDYDLPAYPSMWFRSVIGGFLGLKWLSGGKPILNDQSKFCCSDLVARWLYESIKLKVCPNIDENSVTPADIVCTKVLDTVS